MASTPKPALAERLAANRRGKLTKDQYSQVIAHLERMRRLVWLGVVLVVVSPAVALGLIWLGSGNSVSQFLALLAVVAGVGSGFRMILEIWRNNRLRPILEERKVEGRDVEITSRWWRGSIDRRTGKPVQYLGWSIPIAPGRYRIYFLHGTDLAISCETLEERQGAQE